VDGLRGLHVLLRVTYAYLFYINLWLGSANCCLKAFSSQ
jgi:hypothetical protein